MSEETGSDADVVRRMYEAFQRGDVETALNHFDPEVAVDTTSHVAGETGTGREELIAILGRWIGGFEEWREDIEEIREVGGRVCAVAVQRGRGRSSGVEVEARYAVVYEVRDGLIASMTFHGDPEEVLRDLGGETLP